MIKNTLILFCSFPCFITAMYATTATPQAQASHALTSIKSTPPAQNPSNTMASATLDVADATLLDNNVNETTTNPGMNDNPLLDKTTDADEKEKPIKPEESDTPANEPQTSSATPQPAVPQMLPTQHQLAPPKPEALGDGLPTKNVNALPDDDALPTEDDSALPDDDVLLTENDEDDDDTVLMDDKETDTPPQAQPTATPKTTQSSVSSATTTTVSTQPTSSTPPEDDTFLADEEDDTLLDDDAEDDALLVTDDTTTTTEKDADDTLLLDKENEDDDLLSEAQLPEDDSLDDDDLSDPEPESTTFEAAEGARVEMPLVGEIAFAPSAEAQKAGNLSEEAQANLQASQAMVGKTLVISLLTLKITQTQLANDGKPTMNGTFSLADKKGIFRLHVYNEDETIFEIILDSPFEITVTPDKTIHIKSFLFLISPDKKELYQKVSVFTSDKKETRISLSLDPQEPEASATTQNVIFTQLFPSAKGNGDLEKIVLEDLEFSLPNPIFPVQSEKEININCMAKLDHIKLFDSARLSNSDCTITLAPGMGSFVAEGTDAIDLGGGTLLNQPGVEITITAGSKPEFLITGTLDLKLPLLGKVSQQVKGEKRDDGIELRSRLNKGIKFGPIRIGDPEIIFYTFKGSAGIGSDGGANVTKRLELRGSAKFFGNEIIPIIRFVKSKKSKKRLIQFSAEFKGKKNINPFKDIPGMKSIPGIKDFVLRNAHIGLDSTKKFFIGGATKLLGVATNAALQFARKGVSITATTLQPWKLSDTVSAAKGSIFDSIGLRNVTFTLSSYSYFDATTNMKVNRGVNVTADVDTSQGIFANARKMFGGAMPQQVKTVIILNPNPRHCKFRAILPFNIKLSSKASLLNIAFEISGEPSVALLATLKFTPSKSDPPLLFTTRIEFEPIGAALAGTMQGFWHNPFGIKGLHVGNLAVEVKFPYTAPPVPIAFGITGTMQLGDQIVRVAVKLGADDIVLLGELKYLHLFQMLKLAKQVGVPLDWLKLPDIKFEDLKFKFAPAGGQIGELYFEPGISASGKLLLNIPGVINSKLEAGINIDPMAGFKAYAMMPNTKIGPLKLTGAGKDKKYGTEDDGPILYAVLTPMEQRLFISCQAELLGSKAQAEIDIKLTSIRIRMILKLLGVLDVDIDGESYKRHGRIGFRIVGTTKLGTRNAKLMGDLSTKGLTIAGRMESLTIKDLATVCNQMGAKIPLKLVPDYGYKDVEIFVKA